MENFVGLVLILANLVGLEAAHSAESRNRKRKGNPQKASSGSGPGLIVDLGLLGRAVPNPSTSTSRDLANDESSSANREQEALDRSSGYIHEDTQDVNMEVISSEIFDDKGTKISESLAEPDDTNYMPSAPKKSRKEDGPLIVVRSADAQKISCNSTIHTDKGGGHLDLNLSERSPKEDDKPVEEAKGEMTLNEGKSPMLSTLSEPATNTNSSTLRPENNETCNNGNEGERKSNWADKYIKHFTLMLIDGQITLEEAIQSWKILIRIQDREKARKGGVALSGEIEKAYITHINENVSAESSDRQCDNFLAEMYQLVLLEMEQKENDKEIREILKRINKQLIMRKNWRQIVRKAVLLYRGDKGNLLQKILPVIGFKLSIVVDGRSKRKQVNKEDGKSDKESGTGHNKKEENNQEKITAICKLIFRYVKDTGSTKEDSLKDPTGVNRDPSKGENVRSISEEWCLGNTIVSVHFPESVTHIPSIPDWKIPLWNVTLELLKHMKQDSIYFICGNNANKTFRIHLPQDQEGYKCVLPSSSLRHWRWEHREPLAHFLYLLDIRILTFEIKIPEKAEHEDDKTPEKSKIPRKDKIPGDEKTPELSSANRGIQAVEAIYKFKSAMIRDLPKPPESSEGNTVWPEGFKFEFQTIVKINYENLNFTRDSTDEPDTVDPNSQYVAMRHDKAPEPSPSVTKESKKPEKRKKKDIRDIQESLGKFLGERSDFDSFEITTHNCVLNCFFCFNEIIMNKMLEGKRVTLVQNSSRTERRDLDFLNCLAGAISDDDGPKTVGIKTAKKLKDRLNKILAAKEIKHSVRISVSYHSKSKYHRTFLFTPELVELEKNEKPEVSFTLKRVSLFGKFDDPAYLSEKLLILRTDELEISEADLRNLLTYVDLLTYIKKKSLPVSITAKKLHLYKNRDKDENKNRTLSEPKGLITCDNIEAKMKQFVLKYQKLLTEIKRTLEDESQRPDLYVHEYFNRVFLATYDVLVSDSGAKEKTIDNLSLEQAFHWRREAAE